MFILSDTFFTLLGKLHSVSSPNLQSTGQQQVSLRSVTINRTDQRYSLVQLLCTVKYIAESEIQDAFKSYRKYL